MKSFSSKIGVLLAAAGSAVGLGSIWKFPYVVGENGGGAFIILYIVCALVFGLPLVMNEFLIGKLSGRSAYGASRDCQIHYFCKGVSLYALRKAQRYEA